MFIKILIGFSETAVAVFGVYFKLQSFIFMPIFGLNNGMIPIVAYNYGAKRPARITAAPSGLRLRIESIPAAGSACDAVCPMRLKPRNVKRWMFACTQCGQCISACATTNRDNPNGQLLRWVSGSAAQRNEAGFSALSNTDEDAGGKI